MSIVDYLKRLFCCHEYMLKRWHWSHGLTAMEPRQLEAEMRCWKCGKVRYLHPDRGSTLEKIFSEQTDKYWQ